MASLRFNKSKNIVYEMSFTQLLYIILYIIYNIGKTVITCDLFSLDIYCNSTFVCAIFLNDNTVSVIFE